MRIQISRREVMNNVIRFRDKLLTLKEGGPEEQGKRLYDAFLNRKTGDIRFTTKGAEIELHPQGNQLSMEEWQKIQIAVETEAHNRAHFEARDGANHLLESRGLDPLAWRVIHETLETLNHMASQYAAEVKEALPERAALQDLSNIHLSTLHAAIEDMKGWQGAIDRFASEKRLKNHPVGTYLLRDADPDMQVTAGHLTVSNRTPVKLYVCTFVAKEQKISEVLILCTNSGWTLYHDNPDLFDSEYQYVSSPQAVLKNIHKMAKQPL